MVERNKRAHYIDGSSTTTPSWYYLGVDMEEFNVEMNPEFESKKNIQGTSSTRLKGYDPQASVDPYYADTSDAIYTKLEGIYLNRSTGDACNTTYLEVDLNTQQETPVTNVYKAYKWTDTVIVLQSVGGDTTGYQFKFDLKIGGSKEECWFNVSTKAIVTE